MAQLWRGLGGWHNCRGFGTSVWGVSRGAKKESHEAERSLCRELQGQGQQHVR